MPFLRRSTIFGIPKIVHHSLARQIWRMQLSRFGLRASRLPLRPVARSASVYWNGMQRNSISCPQHRWFSTAPRSVSISVMEGGVENSFSTEDQRVIDLSRHVRNNDLLASLRAYSELPLFLPRSDFRIVCSLMHTLGKRCHVPDLENAFFKIQKMKLTRKHAVTFRCLIRLACELHDTNLIESFYQSICEEETYINNAFLNDIMVDSLFSLDAYASLCNVFDSMHVRLLFSFVSSFIIYECLLFPFPFLTHRFF